ncbi:hypothetical protein [Mesoplasma lactucae]|uniref:Uncharacterized protein n=1 Tax=Mesoplasma lactucae ATCC 49193 TaxID=81460 RepID=A0A291IRT8_9MOLU|nr:hypothetical protein [Mesoplasma lactucae]ATG97493.1 hypothetical protein CP520_01845 [Mesoplasma lactucae ATCC 49193]ATZ20052.1 hypothetical protein MLACT_v1c02310 [Mesoplasma lactucae ATCC 49193]MCL8216800.1 hypothetical protein [Mesoplasma lactucae ATCC 49193]
MSIFTEWEEEFEKDKTAKVNTGTEENFHIRWFFEGFDNLISKTTIQSQISLNMDFQLNHNEILMIDDKVDQLRELSLNTRNALQRYLLEIKNEEKIKNIYVEFLNNFYKNFKDYINEGFIPWIVATVGNFPLHKQLVDWEPLYWEAYRYEYFVLTIMKKMKESIKLISKAIPNDQVYGILANAYDGKIIEQTNLVKNLKHKHE